MIVGHFPAAPGPRIEITPTGAQYEQLCRDLAALREAGAPSNTAAIVDAVRTAAQTSYRQQRPQKRRAAPRRPRHGNRRLSPDAREK